MLLKELQSFEFGGNPVRSQNQQSWRDHDDDGAANQTTLTFDQPNTDGPAPEVVVKIDVSYNTEPTEMEGRNVSFQGNVAIDWDVSEPFIWNGQHLDQIIPAMVPFCWELEGKYNGKQLTQSQTDEVIQQAIENEVGVNKMQAPVSRY